MSVHNITVTAFRKSEESRRNKNKGSQTKSIILSDNRPSHPHKPNAAGHIPNNNTPASGRRKRNFFRTHQATVIPIQNFYPNHPIETETHGRYMAFCQLTITIVPKYKQQCSQQNTTIPLVVATHRLSETIRFFLKINIVIPYSVSSNNHNESEK